MVDDNDDPREAAPPSALGDPETRARVLTMIGEGRHVLLVGQQPELCRLLAERRCRVVVTKSLPFSHTDGFDVVVFDNLADAMSPGRALADTRRLLASAGFVVALALNSAHCANLLAMLGPKVHAPLPGSATRTHLLEIFESAGYYVDEVDRTVHSLADHSPLLPAVNLTEHSAELIDALMHRDDSEALTFILKARPGVSQRFRHLEAGEPDSVGGIRGELVEQRRALEAAVFLMDGLGSKLSSLFALLEAAETQRVVAIDRFRPDESSDGATAPEDRDALRSAEAREHELRARLADVEESKNVCLRCIASLTVENDELRAGRAETVASIASLVAAVRAIESEVTARNAAAVAALHARQNALERQLSGLYASPVWTLRLLEMAVARLLRRL